MRAFPDLERVWWECPRCPGKANVDPVRVSLMRPTCPWCGHTYQDEYVVYPDREPARPARAVARATRRTKSRNAGQQSLLEETG